MYKTEKQEIGSLTTWIEYEPTQEPNGTWKVKATGYVRYAHDSGQVYTAESLTKTTYNHGQDLAIKAALVRVNKLLKQMVASIQGGRLWVRGSAVDPTTPGVHDLSKGTVQCILCGRQHRVYNDHGVREMNGYWEHLNPTCPTCPEKRPLISEPEILKS